MLLGIMTTSGRLAYVNPPVEVDAEFVAKARSEGSAQRRFRFAGACVEGGCPQWTGSRCAVADLAADAAQALQHGGAPLPSCSIRRECRWFAQRGRDACAACSFIVADMGGTDTYRSRQAALHTRDEPDSESG